jgi:hypothetical protein
MDNPQPSSAVPSTPPRQLPLFLLGVLLFILGPALYVIQFRLHHLATPWYVPILATIGVLFLLISARQRRGLMRIVGLLFLALVCGLEWFMLVVATNTPPYSGPAQVGRPLPAFATTLADGTAFSNTDLEKGAPTVLLFFRGRW